VVEQKTGISENGDSPVRQDEYRVLGGAWTGRDEFLLLGLHATWPFCRLVVNRETICLRVLWLEYRMGREDLVEIKRYRCFFSVGIKFIHSVPSLPKLLVFWPLSFGKLKQHLEQFGYTITLNKDR
jgi:hypothetical protein